MVGNVFVLLAVVDQWVACGRPETNLLASTLRPTHTDASVARSLLCCKDADAEKDRCTVNELSRGDCGDAISSSPTADSVLLGRMCACFRRMSISFSTSSTSYGTYTVYMLAAVHVADPIAGYWHVGSFVVCFFFTIALFLEPCCFSRLKKIGIFKNFYSLISVAPLPRWFTQTCFCRIRLQSLYRF